MNFFCISFILSIMATEVPLERFQMSNTVFMTIKSEDSENPFSRTSLLMCKTAYLSRGSYGSLELNFSGKDEDSRVVSLKMKLLFNDKFNVIYNRLENYKYEFLTDHLSFPLRLTDSDFADMFSFFEYPIHSYFWYEIFDGTKSVQREYFGNFNIIIDSIGFSGDSLSLSLNFRADNITDFYFFPCSLTGRIKLRNIPVGWMMVD
ncbi:hypothetical protein JW890_02415 [candidate division WOR-3 bacterium]|nr:hypothetical protein [candidate division WOR-3 bacterium]